ncbi:putative polysaccharide biosynthesis protein [Amphibacillus sediminis]|uniref:putative polysaccharide biosynthesis protein n=1 Tax=Amphibacillus sediminis TaxID=360185 RepID=UPI000831B3F1|nr:polysaccharide biosynthesis protein [Amphibacillus sediminis]
MDKQTEQRLFFKGAFLLTYAGLLSKVLSAAYRIPLQNITGDVGFYVYQQVYPFIGMATMLALYGFPSAISKLLAGQMELPSKKIIQSIFFLLFGFCIIIFSLIYSLAPLIASLMGDLALTNSIKVCAFIFLLIPIVSGLRGLHQGQNNMVPTALSQVVEQLVRVSLIIGISWFIVRFNRSLYEVGIGAVLASITGAVTACLVLIIYQRKQSGRIWQDDSQVSDNWSTLFTRIICYGVVMAINHMLLLLLQFIDAFTLVPQLVEQGVPLVQAQTLKGILDRGQPLAQLGIVTASSLALALIPSVTKARLSKDRERFIGYVSSTWRFTLYLATGATAGLIILFPEVNTVLFKEDIGTFSLRVFSITILFAALSISTAAILQGLGHIYRTAIFVLIGVWIKWVANVLLIAHFGITGAALATVIGSAVILMLNLIQLKKILSLSKLMTVPWQGFGGALSLMIGVTMILNRLAQPIFNNISRIGQFIYLLVIIILAVFVYLKTLIKLNAFSEDEVDAIPFNRFFRKDVN